MSPAQLVNHDTFLQRLTALFESSKERGSIWLTHKRLTYDGKNTVMKSKLAEDGSDGDDREYTCLIRVTDGKETTFSTKVEPSQLYKFHTVYGALLKSSMTTLRKRDKKREKQRADQAIRRKHRILHEVEIKGGKRGNGRRKRQRQIKAARKQEESKRLFKEREEAKLKK